jgi:hypothetical protein
MIENLLGMGLQFWFPQGDQGDFRVRVAIPGNKNKSPIPRPFTKVEVFTLR